mmetsp:Transcript_171209/g.548892  ORF Transcript_171209/g.548892 Transcript_171209/m.548892 type:complete len:327 (-) Transcript_171209:347-1327(-)
MCRATLEGSMRNEITSLAGRMSRLEECRSLDAPRWPADVCRAAIGASVASGAAAAKEEQVQGMLVETVGWSAAVQEEVRETLPGQSQDAVEQADVFLGGGGGKPPPPSHGRGPHPPSPASSSEADAGSEAGSSPEGGGEVAAEAPPTWGDEGRRGAVFAEDEALPLFAPGPAPLDAAAIAPTLVPSPASAAALQANVVPTAGVATNGVATNGVATPGVAVSPGVQEAARPAPPRFDGKPLPALPAQPRAAAAPATAAPLPARATPARAVVRVTSLAALARAAGPPAPVTAAAAPVVTARPASAAAFRPGLAAAPLAARSAAPPWGR